MQLSWETLDVEVAVAERAPRPLTLDARLEVRLVLAQLRLEARGPVDAEIVLGNQRLSITCNPVSVSDPCSPEGIRVVCRRRT
jgi:hypothetical protein